jgi:hypothetical protein
MEDPKTVLLEVEKEQRWRREVREVEDITFRLMKRRSYDLIEVLKMMRTR